MFQKYEFDFAMTCDGCYNAAKRVLAKIGGLLVDYEDHLFQPQRPQN